MESCNCTDHFEHQILNRKVDVNVDSLYEYLFGLDNDFILDFCKKRRISDFKRGDWKTELINGSEIQKRQNSYKVGIKTMGFRNSVQTTVDEVSPRNSHTKLVIVVK
jgi:hypothetical protein